MLDENNQSNFHGEKIDVSSIFHNDDELRYLNDEYRSSIKESLAFSVKSGKSHSPYMGHVLTSLPYWWHSLGNVYLNTMAPPMTISKMGQLNNLVHSESHVDAQDIFVTEQKRKR